MSNTLIIYKGFTIHKNHSALGFSYVLGFGYYSLQGAKNVIDNFLKRNPEHKFEVEKPKEIIKEAERPKW